MEKLKLIAIMVLVLPIIALSQNESQSKFKKYTVQEYVKDRKDWKPNLGNSEIMIMENGYAIGGYDPVAYFTQNEAVKGSESIQLKWNDATWLFVSEKHKDLFERSPTTYSPQYGGWSLIHMAGSGGEGFGAQTRPEDSWVIFQDKLYMIHMVQWADYLRGKEKNMVNLIEYANKQWPKVSKDIKSGALTFWTSLFSRETDVSHEMRPIMAETEVMVPHNGFAIGGYDPVAYFELSEAKKGDGSINYEWNGANWLFSSEKHLKLFKTNPEKYAPQYGGWCSYGMSGHGGPGYGAQTRPRDSWSIIDGKLYFNWSSGVKEMFLKDKDKYIDAANAEWEKIRIALLKGEKVHWKYF
jgi:YHS domain-containing protein